MHFLFSILHLSHNKKEKTKIYFYFFTVSIFNFKKTIFFFSHPFARVQITFLSRSWFLPWDWEAPSKEMINGKKAIIIGSVNNFKIDFYFTVYLDLSLKEWFLFIWRMKKRDAKEVKNLKAAWKGFISVNMKNLSHSWGFSWSHLNFFGGSFHATRTLWSCHYLCSLKKSS